MNLSFPGVHLLPYMMRCHHTASTSESLRIAIDQPFPDILLGFKSCVPSLGIETQPFEERINICCEDNFDGGCSLVVGPVSQDEAVVSECEGYRMKFYGRDKDLSDEAVGSCVEVKRKGRRRDEKEIDLPECLFHQLLLADFPLYQ